jgi:RNA polymerase sigma-70 factor (ECF subfamily)
MPLLLSWARRLGLQDADAADLVQDVFVTLVKKLPEFQYDGQRSFRNWLYTVLLNRWRDLCRRPGLLTAPEGALAEIPGPDAVPMEEAEYRQVLVAHALEIMKCEFSATTWKACWEHVVNGRPAAVVAAELGIGAGSVYVAKSRVLTRLRQELKGLLF